MKTFMFLLCVFLFLGYTQATRQQDLSKSIDGCILIEHTKHNSFDKFKIECTYYQENMVIIKQNMLYVSKKGFIKL